jgi:Spy/CpxP family protein refolding chaperone
MTKRNRRIALAASIFAVAFAIAIASQADDAPTTEPVKHATSRPSAIRLEQPYKQLSDLTDDQKVQIAQIHKKANEDVKAIRDKEDDDIRALLTDDQKAELNKLLEEKREKAAEKMKDKKAAATEPAGG